MAGIAGRVLLLFKGTYNPTTTYSPMDVVYFEGSSYVCKDTALDRVPTDTDYWQIMVGGAYVLSDVLEAGETSITFTNALITDNSLIKVYTNKPDLLYTNIVKGTNSVTITFPEQAEDVTVQIDII